MEMVDKDIICSKSVDDRINCAIVVELFEELKDKTFGGTLYGVFSVQEELGCRGAKVAANAIRPYMGIAIDLTRTGDTPSETDNLRMTVKLGGGPAIKIKDSSLICDKPVVEHLRACAVRSGIEYQDEVLLAGGTDASAMQRSREGTLSAAVSIPGRSIHSPGEIINISDAENAARLIAAAAKTEI